MSISGQNFSPSDPGKCFTKCVTKQKSQGLEVIPACHELVDMISEKVAVNTLIGSSISPNRLLIGYLSETRVPRIPRDYHHVPYENGILNGYPLSDKPQVHLGSWVAPRFKPCPMEMRSTKMALEHSYLLPLPNPKQVLHWVYHGYTGIIMGGKLHCHLSGRVNGCSSTKNPWYFVGIAIVYVYIYIDIYPFP